jgi:hypothetical protein
MSIESTEQDPPPEFVRTVARNIRSQAALKAVTQADIAGEMKLSADAFSQRMTGKTKWTLSDLLAVAKFFGVPLSTIAPDSLTEDVTR